MDKDINQQRLTWLRWLFHSGGLASLIVGICVYQSFFATMVKNQRQRQVAEMKQLESLLDNAGSIEADHHRFQDELNEMQQRAEMIRNRIPDDPQEAAFLVQVTEAARTCGLTIEDYQRGKVTVTDTHSELEIRLTGQGAYESICGFFAELASLPRVTTVRRMVVSAPRGSKSYPLDMTITLYFGARPPDGGETHG